jgi:pilus assembly protein Flp/PilA
MFDLVRDDTGATAIEYALIAMLLSIVIVAGLTALGPSLSAAITSIANAIGGL